MFFHIAYLILKYEFEIKNEVNWEMSLTPQSQSSLQGTFDVWSNIKVLSTKADHREAGM